jgi:hypothetical protein
LPSNEKALAIWRASCCAPNRERFERELLRMRSYSFRQTKYHSNINPQSIIGSLATWKIRFNLPVVFSVSPNLAARQLER